MTDTTPVDDQPATPDDDRRSRRQLLTLAGAAAVGGTALALGQASPAGAANGDPIVAGQTTTASADTALECSAALGGVALRVSGTEAGIGGLRAVGNANPDVKMTGTGRFSQAPFGSGNAEPAHNINDLDVLGAPVVPGHEIVRGTNGSIWASTGSGTGSNTQWKRLNSPRFDNPNGSGGVFAPFRLIDTRSSAGAIALVGKLNSNQTYVLDVDGTPNIPAGAVGVFGNITVLASTFSGFVTLWASGGVPTVANVNFSTGELAGNFFQVGLDSAGQMRVRPGDAAGGQVHVIIDIFGYVQ